MSPSRSAAGGMRWLAPGLLSLLLVVAAVTGPVRGDSAPPVLPPTEGREFLPQLAVSAIAPGESAPLLFSVANPLGQPITNVTVTFTLYAFNPFPGTGSGPLPSVIPGLSIGGGPTGPSVTAALGTLGAGATNISAPIDVEAPPGTPDGTYAVRDSIRFDRSGEVYLLASIGNFAPTVWQNATVLPNGTPTLNLTRLGVSGVIPETAVLVRSTTGLDDALYLILAAAIGFALAAVYAAGRRRGPASRSGAHPPPDDSQAPTALGKRRTNEGD